jgi:16S rRNA (guanine527-N7)-methyltransferase
MDEILKKYSIINQLNVSRETCLDFERFIAMLIEKNKEINIISKETAEKSIIRKRHIIDSVQIIDFVNLNNNTTTDLGSGGGFPGIIIYIMLKNMTMKMNILLYDKSYHKCKFLRDVSKKLNLDTEIIQKDIFDATELKSGTIMARAFKPMPVIIELIYKNFKKYQNLILFMGKSGKKVLDKTLKDWELDFELKKSITNEDSFLLNIKNIKKKN